MTDVNEITIHTEIPLNATMNVTSTIVGYDEDGDPDDSGAATVAEVIVATAAQRLEQETSSRPPCGASFCRKRSFATPATVAGGRA